MFTDRAIFVGSVAPWQAPVEVEGEEWTCSGKNSHEIFHIWSCVKEIQRDATSGLLYIEQLFENVLSLLIIIRIISNGGADYLNMPANSCFCWFVFPRRSLLDMGSGGPPAKQRDIDGALMR